MPDFPGVTHVALTVTDLGRSRPWYQELFGVPPVIDEDTGPFHHVVWLLGSQTLSVFTVPGSSRFRALRRKASGSGPPGVRLREPGRARAVESKLNALGIENGGIVDAPYGSGLSFRDPDNIALEFFAPLGKRMR